MKLVGVFTGLALMISTAARGELIIASETISSQTAYRSAAEGGAIAGRIVDDDLLQTALLSAEFTDLNNFGTGGTSALYDGTNGADSAQSQVVGEIDSDPANGFDGIWQVVFTLDTSLPSNQGGYNITKISTFAAWSDVRRRQKYTIEYQKVTDPAETFNFLGSVNFTPAGGGSTTLRWLDMEFTGEDYVPTGEYLATNVKAIRFNIADPTVAEGDGTLYREFDVAGVAVIPEPSSWMLVAFGLLGAFALRRRRE